MEKVYSTIEEMKPATYAKYRNAIEAGHEWDPITLTFRCLYCGDRFRTGGIKSHANTCESNQFKIKRKKYHKPKCPTCGRFY